MNPTNQQSTQQIGKRKHQGSIAECTMNTDIEETISLTLQCPGSPDYVQSNVLNSSINENKCFSLILAMIISRPLFLPEIRQYNLNGM
jgi:hypothetical protein